MKHQSVHFRATDNSGDMASTPCLYFHLGEPIFFHVYPPPSGLDPTIPIIAGGGGLFSERSQIGLKSLLQGSQTPVIAWGVGFNRLDARKNDKYPEWAFDFNLIGVRDYACGLPWVPCVSCCHSVFDEEISITRELVAYCDHHNRQGLVPGSIPVAYNCVGGSIAEKVRFLGSAETIVTNSYHGMYWGVLLQRKVLVVPSYHSSKFYFFRWPVPMSQPDTWRDDISRAKAFPESLEVCRQANHHFYEKVCDLLF